MMYKEPVKWMNNLWRNGEYVAVMISEINNRSYYWIVLASDSLEELKAMKYTRGVRFLKRAEFDSLPELPVT